MKSFTEGCQAWDTAATSGALSGATALPAPWDATVMPRTPKHILGHLFDPCLVSRPNTCEWHTHTQSCTSVLSSMCFCGQFQLLYTGSQSLQSGANRMWPKQGIQGQCSKACSWSPPKPCSGDTQLGLPAFLYDLFKTASHHILKIHKIIEKLKSSRRRGKKKDRKCSIVNVTLNSNYLTHTKLNCITYNSPTLCRLLCFYFK